jgi:hypothetical protein
LREVLISTVARTEAPERERKVELTALLAKGFGHLAMGKM